jgi:uncharacterized protein YbaP (TraB family)
MLIRLAILVLCFSSWEAAARTCEPLALTDPAEYSVVNHRHGLLWRVTSASGAVSHLFGTIHLGDAEVINLPAPVSAALQSSETYVMEVVLDPRAVLAFSQQMFFVDGRQLTDLLQDELYDRTAQLLAGYGIAEETARLIKPWAAYLTLSFPPGYGDIPMDVVLMNRAYDQHKAVRGLESIEEQTEIFQKLNDDEQVSLLVDLVCNYEVIQGEVGSLKQAYLQRDLQRLVHLSEKFTMGSEELYSRLLRLLLTDRNHRMASRMQPILEAGGAFIAVGALHLPGDEGILSLLEDHGYRIELAY